MKLSTPTLIAGCCVFVCTLAALVALIITNHPTDAVVTLAGPVVAALLITGRVDKHADDQERALTTIQQQTNGVLDKRIKDGARAALREAGIGNDTDS